MLLNCAFYVFVSLVEGLFGYIWLDELVRDTLLVSWSNFLMETGGGDDIWRSWSLFSF